MVRKHQIGSKRTPANMETTASNSTYFLWGNSTRASNNTSDFPFPPNGTDAPYIPYDVPSTAYPWKFVPYQGEPWNAPPDWVIIQPQPIIPVRPARPARKFEIIKRGKLIE